MEKAFTNLSDFSDEKLQQLAVSGDLRAEEQLALRYSRLVRICARPYFLAGGDSEDLTQEGMFGLLSAIREYDSASETLFKTYAEICIKRRIISAVKAASRKKHIPLNEGLSLEDILSEEAGSHIVSCGEVFRRVPEEQVLAKESESEFYSTFSRCLSKFEEKIMRLYLAGLSYAEMAQQLDRPIKSVDNAVQRIRRKLAQQPESGDNS